MKRLALIAGLLGALVAFPITAQQNWSALNQWQVACTPAGDCQITNELREGGAVRSKILIYRVGDAAILEYTIPLGIDIRKGVKLEIDGRASYPTDILTCRIAGCVGFQVLSNRLLNALAQGGELAVAYVSADDNRAQAERFSLVGFTRSYNTFNQ